MASARALCLYDMLLLIVTLSVLGITGRSLAPFGPVAVVTAIALFTSLLDRRVARMEGRAQGRWRNFGIALLLIVHLAPLTLTMVPGFGSDFNQGTQLQRAADELNTLLPEGGPFITDMPWAVAWYAESATGSYRTLDVRRMRRRSGAQLHAAGRRMSPDQGCGEGYRARALQQGLVRRAIRYVDSTRPAKALVLSAYL